ncbi:polycystin-1 [Oncorhynchus kisutch]|uniref:polycystin-1 n=1 Tax=Oncorhynchus kisutch TaxID=8019 RepID=UPI0012DD1FB1|nr:polycystin-1-like [Oncorhynchus kisutch]
MDPSTSTPLPSTSCPPPQQWCPFLGRCLPLASPCHPGSCANCTQADTLPPGALRPSYSLVDEVVVTLPAGPVTHILVRERVEDLLVSPGDIIGLQHDAGPASLLRCDPSPQSPWRQPILALNQSDWLWANSNQSEGSVDLDQSVEITLEDVRGGVWAADVVCPIRVLYVGHSETQLQGSQLSSGLPQPGLYSLEVTSDDPAFPVMASCPIRVVPPLGLTVLHPPSQNGTYYFRPNQTVVLLRVHSQYGAKAHWQGSNQSVLFQDHCPPDFLPTVGECRGAGRAGEPGRGGGNQSHSLFAVIDLGLGEERGPVVVNLSAHSEVTEASLSLLVGVEEPLRGLVVQPHPRHRVLMESVVSYTAAVEGGSSPTFKWTVDDKPYFTYYNTVLNIIYQNPAVYKLSVTAMNHVSNLTDHFNVTVDRMNPMVNLTVTGVPGVVTQGSDQFLTTSVVLDVSVDATFRWSFGDGGYQEYDFKPPYNTSLYPPLPDSPTQVLLPNKVKYKYQQPGVYTVLVSVSNHYENRTQRIDMHVYSVLTHVDIETEPRLLQAGQPAAFEAHALPSAYGIVYTWDFADGSASREGPQRRVNHTYGVGHSGVHNVCVSVNNTISWTKACAEMLVYEEIKGLTATSSAPTELNTRRRSLHTCRQGNNVTWSFDMGDVSMVTTAGSEVPHTYVKDGNYTVNVTARNAVSARWTLVPVQVFVLQVVRLEPAGCVRELTQVDFQAFVSGNASSHLYEWSFGDGTPNQTHLGSPRISHSYGGSGDYHLSLLLSSGVNKANFFAWVCVQPAVSNVTLTPEKCNFRLGEESRFRASARPDFDYTYLWDFGVIEDSTPVQGHKDMVFTYKTLVSTCNDSVLIQIQRPVGLVLIQHNGTRSNNLTLREVYLFTTSSLAPASLYTWDFGDGTPLAPGPNATHAYNVSGVFNVTLTAANPVSSNHTCVAVAVLAPIRGLVVTLIGSTSP